MARKTGTARACTLRYWQIYQEHHVYSLQDYPEIHWAYPTLEAAVAAAESILRQVASRYEREVAEYNARPSRPEAAKKAWDSPEKTACVSETRIVECAITRLPRDHHDAVRESATVRLDPVVDVRCAWRDVQMRTTIRPDGTTEIAYSLGEPGPWGEWKRRGEAGYFLSVVELTARSYTLTVAGDVKDIAGWVRRGTRA